LLDDLAVEGGARFAPAGLEEVESGGRGGAVGCGEVAGVECEEDGLRLEAGEAARLALAHELLVVHAVGGFVDLDGEAAAKAGDSDAGRKMRCGGGAEDGEAQGLEAGEGAVGFQRVEEGAVELCGLGEVEAAGGELAQAAFGVGGGKSLYFAKGVVEVFA